MLSVALFVLNSELMQEETRQLLAERHEQLARDTEKTMEVMRERELKMGETERALVVAAIEAASEKVRAERQGTETPPAAWADAVTRSAWALVSRIFPRGEQP